MSITNYSLILKNLTPTQKVFKIILYLVILSSKVHQLYKNMKNNN